MARERRTDQPAPEPVEGGTATVEKPRGRQRGTATTPGAPLGRPVVVEPMVEQVTEGEDVTDVAPQVDFLNDREWLFEQVTHRMDCPMIDAPFTQPMRDGWFVRSETGWDEVSEATPGAVKRRVPDGEPGRAQRMDTHLATEPRTDQNPMPRTYRIIACLDCGARARIKLPRED